MREKQKIDVYNHDIARKEGTTLNRKATHTHRARHLLWRVCRVVAWTQ